MFPSAGLNLQVYVNVDTKSIKNHYDNANNESQRGMNDKKICILV